MSISNGTEERVGVEVSGPTRYTLEKIAIFTGGAGSGAAASGLLIGDGVVTVTGFSIAAASLALYLLILSGLIFRHVLKPRGCKGSTLIGFDSFDDMTVKFFHGGIYPFGEQIAQVDFVASKITYGEEDSMLFSSPSDPTSITLNPSDEAGGYLVHIA